MHIYMSIYMSINICIYVHIYTFECIYIYIYIHIYLWTCIYLMRYMYVCVNLNTLCIVQIGSFIVDHDYLSLSTLSSPIQLHPIILSHLLSSPSVEDSVGLNSVPANSGYFFFSLTWIKAIWGWFPLLTIIYGEVVVRSL